MVHQWYIMNHSKTPKLLILRGLHLSPVRVRVPLSAHDISDLAPKTWYIMVHYVPNGTLNGTLSITPDPRPGSTGVFSVLSTQIITMYETLACRTILLYANPTHPMLPSNFHQL